MKSFESSLFKQHQATTKHLSHLNAPLKVQNGQKTIQFSTATQFDDEAIWIHISSAWWLAHERLAIHKYGSLVQFRLAEKGYKSTAYVDDKSGWEIVTLLGEHFRKLLKARVQMSPFYAIMADETMDKSTTLQLLIYIKFIEYNEELDDYYITIHYLDLVSLASGSAENIMVCYTLSSKLIIRLQFISLFDHLA